ncbi:hypothetical protein AVU43_gp05 [Ralstonia phage RSJ5]|uniref:Uncharacterized protein n=1 Tax=Ralstonia phage RSJ5 TaxID=1538364 RepID=A0A077KYI0_9CAUD|nr:hypothetical protein AVU43_gp05 [Ralstonia phage RSJ5]BAP34899.1 hypothetical protein [Ralstonia phage RSJ5]
MAAIQSIYWQHSAEHTKPKKAKAPGSDNKALRGSDKYHGEKYAITEKPSTWGKKVLRAIEKARKAGDVVRLVSGEWQINGRPLGV